jgi:hypothetical protein
MVNPVSFACSLQWLLQFVDFAEQLATQRLPSPE